MLYSFCSRSQVHLFQKDSTISSLTKKTGTVLFQDISLALTADYTLFQAPGLQTEKPPFPLSLVGENREADLSRERCRAVWSAPGKEACAESPEGLKQLREITEKVEPEKHSKGLAGRRRPPPPKKKF